MRDRPYSERREQLEARRLNGPTWQTPDYLEVDIASTLEATAEQGLEGLVVKRLSSPYRGTCRNHDWLKLKNRNRQEFVVGGSLRAGVRGVTRSDPCCSVTGTTDRAGGSTSVMPGEWVRASAGGPQGDRRRSVRLRA